MQTRSTSNMSADALLGHRQTRTVFGLSGLCMDASGIFFLFLLQSKWCHFPIGHAIHKLSFSLPEFRFNNVYCAR